jgi:hypothetical protein
LVPKVVIPRGDTGDKCPVSLIQVNAPYGMRKNIASDNQSPTPDLPVVELFCRAAENYLLSVRPSTCVRPFKFLPDPHFGEKLCIKCQI